MRLATLLVALVLLLSSTSPALTAVTVTLNYSYDDVEARELSSTVQVGDVVYAAGTKGRYVFIAAYRGGERLWATTYNVGGNASVLSLNLNLEGGALKLIAYSRLHNITKLHLLTLNLNGGIVAREDYTVNPRLFPLAAVAVGDSIYVAGASFIFGDSLNYMVARVSAKGVEWVKEDREDVGGGFGDDILKCIGLTLGSRLFVAGDNGTSVSIMIVSQTGDVVRNYVVAYPNVTVTVNGCFKVSDSTFILYGALNYRPMLMPIAIKPDLDIVASLLVVGDLVGIITAMAGEGSIIAPYVVSANQSVILIYRFNGSHLELLNLVNVTGVAGGFVALSGTLLNSSLTYAGYDKMGAKVVSFIILLEERGARVSRIPLFDVIGDPRLTATLLAVIVSFTLYIAYRRVKGRRPAS